MTYTTPTFCPSCHGRTDRGFDGPSCPGHPTDSDLATDCHNRLSSTLTFGDCCCDDHATCTCHRNSSAGACDTCLSLSHERADDSLRDLLIVLADVDPDRAYSLIQSATVRAA